MADLSLTEKLAYLRDRGGEDESALLARAVREGIQTLFREALIEAYLAGQMDRERLVSEIGLEAVETFDFQRDALIGDIRWGTLIG